MVKTDIERYLIPVRETLKHIKLVLPTSFRICSNAIYSLPKHVLKFVITDVLLSVNTLNITVFFLFLVLGHITCVCVLKLFRIVFVCILHE